MPPGLRTLKQYNTVSLQPENTHILKLVHRPTTSQFLLQEEIIGAGCGDRGEE
jgi:hypothetical protein